MSFEYVTEYYGAPACIGRRVTINGQPGIIVEDRGHYIGVNLDSDKPGVVSNAHPTWKVEYLGMGKFRKITKAQARYKRWLEHGSDCFDTFIDFCRFETSNGR